MRAGPVEPVSAPLTPAFPVIAGCWSVRPDHFRLLPALRRAETSRRKSAPSGPEAAEAAEAAISRPSPLPRRCTPDRPPVTCPGPPVTCAE